MQFDVITIFPEIFQGFVSESLIARAQAKDIFKIGLHNLRDWTDDPHKKARPTEGRKSFGRVDDKPFGGGVGMVMKVEPIQKAVSSLLESGIKNNKSDKKQTKQRVILFSPRGEKFDQKAAKRLSKYDQLIFICGRYEGIDERVAKYIADETLSIGDYVLNGGEVAAMVVIEAVARMVPGFIAKEDSATKADHPQYTRPEVIEIAGKKRKTPKVLLSGDHAKIEEWRRSQK